MILDERPNCQIMIPRLSDGIYRSPHYYVLSLLTLWILIWAFIFSMTVFPRTQGVQEGKGFFHHIFPELSSVAPTKCSVIIYWMRECQCNLEEQWSTLLSVVCGKWQALAFWRLRSHWDKCSFSFSLPSLLVHAPASQIPLFLSLSNKSRVRNFTCYSQI